MLTKLENIIGVWELTSHSRDVDPFRVIRRMRSGTEHRFRLIHVFTHFGLNFG